MKRDVRRGTESRSKKCGFSGFACVLATFVSYVVVFLQMWLCVCLGAVRRPTLENFSFR